jgi:hypothetical protein
VAIITAGNSADEGQRSGRAAGGRLTPAVL